MKRNIFSTLTVFKNDFLLTILEQKENGSFIEIFNQSCYVNELDFFLKNSIKKANALLGAKLQKINLVFDNFEIEKYDHFLSFDVLEKNSFLQLQDVEIFIEKKCNEIDNNEQKVLNIQIVKYNDENGNTYSSFPENTNFTKLEIVTSISIVDRKIYDYVSSTLSSNDLEIDSLALSSQCLTYGKLSSNALSSGAILVSSQKGKTIITINKNFSTLVSTQIIGFDINDLANCFNRKINETLEQTKKILFSQNNCFNDEEEEKIIYLKENHRHNLKLTNKEFNKILFMFLNDFLLSLKNIFQKIDIKNLPIIFSGEIFLIKNVEKFLVENFKQSFISVYHPLSFIEFNEKNIYAIGLIKLNENIEKQFKKFNVKLIDTIPNNIYQLSSYLGKNKNLFTRFISKIASSFDLI